MTNSSSPDTVRAFADELRKYWSFDDDQQHTHSWHDRENFIERKLPGLLAGFAQGRVPKVRTSHHRNKEEAARLQALVDQKYTEPTQTATREALEEINALISNGDRPTVNERNAFEHFTVLNRLLLNIRDIARRALSSVPSTDQREGVMAAAEKAAGVVDGWSDAKKDYANRVIGGTNFCGHGMMAVLCPTCSAVTSNMREDK